MISVKKADSMKQPFTLLCFAILFFLYLMEKTHVVAKSEQLLILIDLLEWPLYIGAFLGSLVKTRFNIKQLTCIILVCISFLITYLVTSFAELLKSALLVVAMKNVDFKKILLVMRNVLIASIFLTIIMYFTGISDAGIQRRGAISLGYVQANTLGFVLMLLTFLTLAHQERISRSTQFVLVMINVLGFLISDGRSSVLLSICAIILASNKYVLRLMEKHEWCVKLMALSTVLCGGFSFITAMLYPHSKIVQLLDNLFSSRIWLNYYNLNKYRLTLFGQNIQFWDMTSVVYNPIKNIYSTYMTVDNVYVSMILQMGLVSGVLVSILCYKAVIKHAKKKQYALIIILTLLSAYGIVENSVMSVYVCFPLLILSEQPLKH